MTKTPEELAEEWSIQLRPNQDVEECELRWDLVCDWEKESFLAGYQAAQEQQEKEWGALVSKGRIAMQTLNDQFADADKVMNFPENPDDCDHILDMEKMVGVNSCSCKGILNNWISVKDRLPEDNGPILMWSGRLEHVPTCAAAGYELWNWSTEYSPHDFRLHEITHWMPLPNPPKDDTL